MKMNHEKIVNMNQQKKFNILEGNKTEVLQQLAYENKFFFKAYFTSDFIIYQP